MAKSIKKAKTFRCGIIYGSESSSGDGKITFDSDGFTIDGGFFHDVKYRAAYSEIECVFYTSVLPKMRFALIHTCIGEQKRIPVGLSLRHSQLAAILRLLRERGLPVRKMSFLPRVGDWWRFWYGQY